MAKTPSPPLVVLCLLGVTCLASGCAMSAPGEAPSSPAATEVTSAPPGFRIEEVPEHFWQVSDTVSPAPDIEALIAPYRLQMEEHLEEEIAIAEGDFFKADPEGALDNLVADALFSVVQRMTDDSVHVVLLNDGGLRVPVAEGPIQMRHAYELLPFENYITVLTLSGTQLLRLADEIAATGGEPVAGWTIVLDEGKAAEVLVGGEPIEQSRDYRLATVDYLATGGGDWPVIWEAAARGSEDLEVLIRDVWIEYLREVGSVRPTLDGRIR